jgi:Tol biopolymer transport system component/DNA-binding winged helix-turn-helix (wHTH) protein
VPRVRFSEFELDENSGELWKDGARQLVAEQPLALLRALLARPGDLVGRDELRQRLWPADTFVDFEHGLNAAVKKLRDALGDSADSPRFIETIPRRGYRFIARVEPLTPDAGEPARSAADSSPNPTVTRGVLSYTQPQALTRSSKTDRFWRSKLNLVGILVALAACLGAVAIAWNALRSNSGPPPNVTWFEIALPPGDTLVQRGHQSSVALSPDGSRLAYAAWRNEERQLFLRSMDQPVVIPIPGTQGVQGAPFFSPDGKWIGFVAGGKLLKAPVAGGPPVEICRALNSKGASWGPDNTIVFAPNAFGGLWRVSAFGGTPTRLTTLDTKRLERTHRLPEILPNGKAVLFTIGTMRMDSYDDAIIEVLSLETGQRQLVLERGTNPHYSSTGHLVFARQGALFAVPFDPLRLVVTGPSVKVLDGVDQNNGGAAAFGLSMNGSIIYAPRYPHRYEQKVLWVDRRGNAQPLMSATGDFEWPRLSPDSRRLALLTQGATDRVSVYDLSRNTLTRLTFKSSAGWPLWTPDGQHVTYACLGTSHQGLCWVSTDARSDEELLLDSQRDQDPSSWSPDGQQLVYTDYDVSTGADIWALPLNGRKPRTLLRTAFNESDGKVSPNGKWLAYMSDETGRYEIYVRPFPDGDRKIQISNAGGKAPIWARSGHEIFYRNETKMMAVSFPDPRSLSPGVPRLLFEKTCKDWYDVTADGQRFVMIAPVEQPQAAQPINVILNWYRELERDSPH